MNMETYVELVQSLLISIILLTLTIGLLVIISKYLKQKILLEKTKLDITFPYDSDLSVIDIIINNEVESYKLYNIISKQIVYINEEEQQKMIYAVLKNVLASISPHLINKLKFIYNYNIIEDIICEKVKTKVLETAIDINSSSNSSKTKNK